MSAGLVRVLELLEEELIIDIGLLGVTRIDQISAKFVCKAPAGLCAQRDERVSSFTRRAGAVTAAGVS